MKTPEQNWNECFAAVFASKNMNEAAVQKLRKIFLGAQFQAFQQLVMSDESPEETYNRLELWKKEFDTFQAELLASRFLHSVSQSSANPQ